MLCHVSLDSFNKRWRWKVFAGFLWLFIKLIKYIEFLVLVPRHLVLNLKTSGMLLLIFSEDCPSWFLSPLQSWSPETSLSDHPGSSRCLSHLLDIVSWTQCFCFSLGLYSAGAYVPQELLVKGCNFAFNFELVWRSSYWSPNSLS